MSFTVGFEKCRAYRNWFRGFRIMRGRGGEEGGGGGGQPPVFLWNNNTIGNSQTVPRHALFHTHVEKGSLQDREKKSQDSRAVKETRV